MPSSHRQKLSHDEDALNSSAMPPVHSKLYDVNRSPFNQFSALRTHQHVKQETGFSADTLEYIWDRYNDCLPKRQRDQEARCDPHQFL